jgi:hypothetical protein
MLMLGLLDIMWLSSIYGVDTYDIDNDADVNGDFDFDSGFDFDTGF